MHPKIDAIAIGATDIEQGRRFYEQGLADPDGFLWKIASAG